jgi:hypothetical protein
MFQTFVFDHRYSSHEKFLLFDRLFIVCISQNHLKGFHISVSVLSNLILTFLLHWLLLHLLVEIVITHLVCQFHCFSTSLTITFPFGYVSHWFKHLKIYPFTVSLNLLMFSFHLCTSSITDALPSAMHQLNRFSIAIVYLFVLMIHFLVSDYQFSHSNHFHFVSLFLSDFQVYLSWFANPIVIEVRGLVFCIKLRCWVVLRFFAYYFQSPTPTVVSQM